MDTKQLSKSMAQTTSAKGTTAVAKAEKPQSPSVYVGNLLAHYKGDIAQALPSVITPERFTRIATTAVSANPKLMQAVTESPKSFVGALMTAAQLGVEPNTPLGQAYLLPYNNNRKVGGQWVKKMEVQFQLGYKGVIDLCYRSGEVTYINAEVVYANDEFDYGMGLDPYLKHRPFEGEDPGPAVKYYAVFKTKSGASLFKVWSREKVEAHAKRFSKSYNAKEGEFYGPWATDFDAMAKKTVLIDVLNYAPKKSDFARALAAEGSVKTEISKDMSQVRDENVIDAEYEEVQRSGGAETVQSDKEKAEALADSLGMKRGSDLASKNGGDEDLGDVE